MHNSLLINNIGLNKKYILQKTSGTHQEFKGNLEQSNNKKSKVIMYTLAGLAVIGATGVLIHKIRHGKVKPTGIRIPDPVMPVENPISLRGLEELVSSEIPVDNRIYRFMKGNPRGFYLEYGKEVNKFLRKGTFEELPLNSETFSPELQRIIQNDIKEQKELNRIIVESIESMDAKITSKTTEPMTVYRDAPRQWMDSAKNGILTDPAYVSTSTERGASLEGRICNGADNFTYEIRLPKGTRYWDMTDTTEKEMLLPRNSKFKVIRQGVLELII